MVYRPTRGDGPRRHGGGVPLLPGIDPSVLDARAYTDPERYELERVHVLRRSWLIAGRTEEIPESGDHLLYQGHGETVAVVRQQDGGVAAFHNVCQHRGAPLIRENGCGAERFVCPWHGWAYGLDGKLRGVPDRGDFAEAQLKGLRAPAVAVEEWAGWLWIFLAGPDEAPSLEEWLGEIGTELAAYRMEDMYLEEKVVWDLPCNYKAVVDGFNEMYHVVETHNVPPDVAKASRQTAFDILGRNSLMVVPLSPTDLEELERSGDHQGNVTCHYVVFPTAVFNNLPNHLQLFRPVPTGPNTTRFETYELQYRDGDKDYREGVDFGWAILKTIVEQDITIFKDLAETRDSMGYNANRFSNRECKPTAYHSEMARMIADAMGSDGEAPIAPVSVPQPSDESPDS